MEHRLASAAFVLVVATYIFLGGMGVTDRDNPEPRDAAYNLLARGLLSGHLYLDKAAPEVLTRLKDPLDPGQNEVARDDPRYRLHDLSYRNGRLYLYFGVAPALLVFIPWHVLTGGWLPHWCAVILLCSIGLAVNVQLLRSLRALIFPGSPVWILSVLVLVLGLGSYAPLLAARADMWEIPIAFNYLAMSAALWFVWKAATRPERAVTYVACASVAFGAAFLSRPTVLPCVAVLLLPFASRAVRANPVAWAAAALPLGLCGAAAALYNALRFGGPFDFGESSQLAGVYVAHLHTFSARFVPANLRLYLFQGVDWSRVFPFVHEAALGPIFEDLPAGHGGVEHISGVLVYAPILWAALAVPAFIQIRRPEQALSLISIAAAWIAASMLLFVSFFFGTCSRYQFEFVPALALLAAFGVLSLESMLRAGWLAAARSVWIALALVSGAFTVLYGIDRCADDHNGYAVQLLVLGNARDAEHEIGNAQMLSPGNPRSRLLSGIILARGGRTLEAREHFEALVRDFPGDAYAHYWLGIILDVMQRRSEAAVQHRIARELAPWDLTIKAALDADLARPK
jgi:tetratricopeptide (TPR) repeat protein